MSIILIAGLLISGLLISTISMGIGIGGGILWTPLLILVYGLSPAEAIACSLAIQIAGLGSGTYGYYKTGLIMPKLSLTLAAIAIPGIIVGSIMTININPQAIQLSLGAIGLMLAVYFVSGSEDYTTQDKNIKTFEFEKIKPILAVTAILGGMMGFLSAGIGEWIIPLIKRRLGISMRQAVASIVMMMFILALTASIIHLSQAETIHHDIILWGAAGTLTGAQFGVYFSRIFKDQILKNAFIFFMALIGIHLIFNAV